MANALTHTQTGMMMMRTPTTDFRKRWLALVLVTVVAGCGSDPVSVADLSRAAARARWDAQGLTHYTVEARILCFCPPAMNAWHEITVSSGEVFSLRPLVNMPEQSAAEPGWFSTVDEVFDQMDNWSTLGAGFRIVASFDPETGLPTRVELHTPPTIADGGATYEFRALKPGLTAP